MSFTAEQLVLRDRAITSTTCEQWASQEGWVLRRGSGWLTGPCPVCGGTDRFGINPGKNNWNCRQCEKGGDVIALVMHTENLPFFEACERITGESAAKPISAEEQARLEAQRRGEREERDRVEAAKRAKAQRDAVALWNAAYNVQKLRRDVVAEYLRIRGIDGGSISLADRGWADAIGFDIKCNKLGYWHEERRLHEGPVMIAPIQKVDGTLVGVHLTYLDLDRPKGKLVLTDAKGEELPSKKVRGSHRGCAIQMVTPPGATRLVMGEGIETTLTALAHAPWPDTAYWAGVAIDNMAGKAARNINGGAVHDQPNMDDLDCFLPPDWVHELVYLCDGDEPRKHTVEKVQRGLRRASRLRERARLVDPSLPTLDIKWVPQGSAGTDLNDLAMTPNDEEGGAA